MTVPPAFRISDPAVVLHLAELPPSDIALLEVARIATPLRTVLDIASTHYDEGFVEAIAVDALDTHRFTRRKLAERLARWIPQRRHGMPCVGSRRGMILSRSDGLR